MVGDAQQALCSKVCCCEHADDNGLLTTIACYGLATLEGLS